MQLEHPLLPSFSLLSSISLCLHQADTNVTPVEMRAVLNERISTGRLLKSRQATSRES